MVFFDIASSLEMPEPTGLTAAQTSFNTADVVLLTVVALFMYCFLFDLPATPLFGDGDQSIFLYEAQRLHRGEVIYRDFFEFTFPGAQSWYALLFGIFGERFWIVSVTVLVLGVATAALILKISKHVIPSPAHYLPVVLYVFFGFRWVGFDGSHRMFSPVFILLAILLLFRAGMWWKYALVGTLLGLASFFTQQRGVVALVAVGVFLLVEGYLLGSVRDGFKKFFIVATSFAVSLLMLCIYFIFQAGPGLFFESTLLYPLTYYGYGHPNNYSVFLADIRAAFQISRPGDLLAVAPTLFHCLIVPVGLITALVVLIRRVRAATWEQYRVISLITITAVLLTLTTSGPNFFRLFQIAGFSLIALVWVIRHYLPIPITRVATVALCSGLIFLGMFQAVRVQTYWEVSHLETPVGRLALIESKQAERYRWIAENTQPGEYFFEVYEPFVYFPLGLLNPTRFGQIWPSEYTRPEHISEVITDLSVKRPRLILWDNSYHMPPQSRSPGDHTGPLAEFVGQNYVPIGEVYDVGGKPVQIWQLKAL